MSGYLPAGWPAGVGPPGAVDWQSRAGRYLIDCCAPDFRRYAVLTRYPVVLAGFAQHCVSGERRAAADAVGLVRTELEDQVGPEVIAAAVDAWQSELARLARVEREVGLLRRALSGERFVPKLE
ncbi:hypothetical protein FOE78_12570 [Microlunatus elymi]|uniref:Uncharacterized protein n=1 Tax=Microlunatus elymi TaxID=2596828 RepID=A0A516PZM6_9ACTN|nr:hypothetical protein [Microlunatus elymi]QDP96635.1 hypothetical protein FOE78_12570 [Microlunatus elymi]